MPSSAPQSSLECGSRCIDSFLWIKRSESGKTTKIIYMISFFFNPVALMSLETRERKGLIDFFDWIHKNNKIMYLYFCQLNRWHKNKANFSPQLSHNMGMTILEWFNSLCQNLSRSSSICLSVPSSAYSIFSFLHSSRGICGIWIEKTGFARGMFTVCARQKQDCLYTGCA